MRGILHYLWLYRARIFLGLVALFIVDGAQLVIPLIIRAAIDELAQTGNRPACPLRWVYLRALRLSSRSFASSGAILSSARRA
jgi:ABC-type multidrug transport system fused ATPase/permease subunit